MSGRIKISVSNIAWDKSRDNDMYAFLRDEGIEGLEIAPTRIFPEAPYEKIKGAREFRRELFEKYHLEISSMQSIWYGRKERIFGSKQERAALIDYTERAFEFAQALGCSNLVFGCPKNRNVDPDEKEDVAVEFFEKLGELACSWGTVLAVEANPPIYGTNYLNTTRDVCRLVKEVNSDGVGINYDFGTVLYNRESVAEISSMPGLIHHVHISEPGLAAVSIDDRHKGLIPCLKEIRYERYISLEMKDLGDVDRVQQIIRQLKSLVRENDD